MIPPSHSLEATPTLSNFSFVDDLKWPQYVEDTPFQKRSSISSEIRRGLGLFHLSTQTRLWVLLYAPSFHSNARWMKSRIQAPPRHENLGDRIDCDTQPRVQQHRVMWLWKRTFQRILFSPDSPGCLLVTEKHLGHSIQQVPSLLARLIITRAYSCSTPACISLLIST